MIVLDASGSMWGQIDGKPKIQIAREVMSRVLTDLDGKANIGVLTYGHRKKGACDDIETIIPLGKVNHKKYMAAINRLSPKGKTPITDAVRKGAEALGYTEKKATVVLVSDGLETCEADPCALARELESKGIDFTVHVVGFDLKDEDTSSLQCLADETGGKYLAADNADDLGNAFGTVVAQAPSPKVEPKAEPIPEIAPKPANTPAELRVGVYLSEESEPLKQAYVYIIPKAANKDRKQAVGSGTSRRTYKVSPGKYYVEAKVSNIIGVTEINVKSGQENQAKVVLNAGLLSVRAIEVEGGEPIKKAYIKVLEFSAQTDGKRKYITGGNQRKIFTLPVGKYFVEASRGDAKVGQEVEVTAGQKTDATIILASGLLQVDVLNAEGGKPQTRGAYVYVYDNNKQTDGSRNRISGSNPRTKFTLPAGVYYVEATIGKVKMGKEVNISAGQLTHTSIVVGVGALKTLVVPVDGGKSLVKAYIYIFEKEKQLDGSRKPIAGANQRTTFKLPPGEYQVVATIGKVEVAKDVEIKAGKLTETTININAGALLVDAPKSVQTTVFATEKNLDGTRDVIARVGNGKPMMLSAGKYIVVGKDGSKLVEEEVEIKAGKLAEIKFRP